MAETATYDVTGMTCDHCARAVVSEVGALDGVTGVEVDLVAGKVTVASNAPLSLESVRAAVEEAGYEVTP